MKDLDQIKQIELYLENILPCGELKSFEENLVTDKELANKLANFNTAINEVKSYYRDDLKSKLKHIHKEVIPERVSETPGIKNYLKVAAVILALIVLSTPLIYNKFFKQSNCDQLFTEYFEPYTNVTTQRGNDIEESNLLKQSAMYYYEKKEYDKAIVNFDELMNKENCCDLTTMFYYGVSCLGVEDNEKAIEVLSELSVNEESVLYEQTTWYLSLAYLKTNNKVKTQELLNKLVLFEGSYADRANDLLREL